MEKLNCPHCKEELILRCYYESFEDVPAIVNADNELSPDLFKVVNEFEDRPDEYTDYECANCKMNVKELVFKNLDKLKKLFPNSF